MWIDIEQNFNFYNFSCSYVEKWNLEKFQLDEKLILSIDATSTCTISKTISWHHYVDTIVRERKRCERRKWREIKWGRRWCHLKINLILHDVSIEEEGGV